MKINSNMAFLFMMHNSMLGHSQHEKRYYCFGLNEKGNGILTVRFTYRSGCIRIIGAGYWRKGKKSYEQSNSI